MIIYALFSSGPDGGSINRGGPIKRSTFINGIFQRSAFVNRFLEVVLSPKMESVTMKVEEYFWRLSHFLPSSVNQNTCLPNSF